MTMHAIKLTMDRSIVGVRDAIYSRRATRSYVPEPVSEILVRTLLDAAIHAPSAMNSQPWAFVVIQRPGLLKKISDAARTHLAGSSRQPHPSELPRVPFEDPAFNIFYDAGTLIVICGRFDPVLSPVGDCHLAAENLMLAAHELGLATCPIGLARDVLREPAWREELAIPKGYDPILPIIVGYAAAEGATRAVRRAPVAILSWLR